MKKLSIFAVAFIVMQFVLGVAFTFGIPANPTPIQFQQPNGQVVTIVLQGDEFVHWAVSTDGYTLLQNKQGGYEYAVMQNGQLMRSGILASNPSKRSFAEKSLLMGVQKGLQMPQEQILATKYTSGIKPGKRAGGSIFPKTGSPKLLVILADFSNTTPTYTQTQFNNYMNQTGYNGTGSFKDFYYENSYGQLSIVTVVTAWVKVPGTHDSYGPDSEWGRFAMEAVNAADAAGLDFSQFGISGTVPGVAIIHQGPGQEETSSTKDIWSHSWQLSSAGYTTTQRTKDGVLVDAYTCNPEKSGTGMATIGVMCHEVGHNLGAPDYYDTNYSTGGQYPGTGDWDVMCSGSYNGSPSGSKPAHHNAYTKSVVYGWLTPTVLSAATTITNMPNFAQNAVVYKYNTTTTNEYFLIENRQQVGFDANLPGHGMVIYHVDGTYITNHMSANDINATSHQGLHPEAAGGTIDATSCPFPGTGAKTSFTDATTPNSKSWANAATNKPITEISEVSGMINFKFMGGSQTCTAAPTATTNAATSVNATSAVLNATVTSSCTPTVTFEYGTTTSYGYTASGNPATISGLTANTTYHFRVKAVNTIGTTYGSDMTFTTPIQSSCPTVTYCASKGSSVTYEWIDLVQLGSINNATATKPASGYSNFTTKSTNLTKGTAYTITFSAGFKRTIYTEYWNIWIDYNADGTFTSDELVVSGSSAVKTNLTGTFTVPTSAASCTTRMRVSMSSASGATSCSTFSYGEVEDYTVVISGTKRAVVETPVSEAVEMSVYPSPAKDYVDVALTSANNTRIAIYNMSGKLVKSMTVNALQTRIDVANLPSGIYTIVVGNINKRFIKQ